MSNTVEDSIVNENYSVTVPASVREEANLEAGDRFRWRIMEAGNLEVEVLERRHGAFSDLEPVDAGEETNASVDHDALARD